MDTRRRRPWPTIVAVAWAALCVALSVVTVATHLVAGPHDERVFTFFWADAVVGFTFPLVGAFVAWKQPRNVTWIVLALGGLVGVSAFSHEVVYHVGVAGRGSVLVAPLAWLTMWTWVGYWLQTTLLPLLFPDGRLPSRRWRPVLWGVVALLAAGALASAFRPGDVDGIASSRVQNPLGLGTEDDAFIAVQTTTSMLTSLPGTAACIYGLWVRRRRSRGRVRAQIDWLVLGFATCLALVAATALLGQSLPAVRDLLFVLAFSAIPAAIAVAVWRHELFGVDAALRRAVLYTALTGVAGSVYAAVVAAAGIAGVQGRVGAPAAAVAVLVASAARARVRTFVDRRLFGVRREPLEVITLLNEIRDTGEGAAAVQRVVDTVAEAFALPWVSVVVSGDPLVSRGGPAENPVEIPITAEGRQLATLVVGRRHPGELEPSEHTALVTAARRIGAILHTEAVARDLQHIREELVTAREEERRRLRRDLHDGVGPSLAGMALQVEALANRLGPETGLTERAEALREQLQQTASEVRRIVRGLRPAAVDDLGLAEALRQLARLDGDEGRVVIRVPEDLPEMPAAVEGSAYRIAAEAVTNSLRHGRPAECVLEVSANGSWLTLEVRDDGTGFGPETASGVGLRSMHERTSEVGGELAIRSAPGEGTTVVARLPWRAP